MACGNLRGSHLVGVITSAHCFRLWPSQDVQAVNVDHNSRLAQISPWDLQEHSTYAAIPHQRHVMLDKGNLRCFVQLQLICKHLSRPFGVPNAILYMEFGISITRVGLQCKWTHLQCERSEKPRLDSDGEIEVC